jgi:electron transfer flavoprotein alpha subunit
VTAARKIGGDIHVLVVGANAGAAAKAASSIAGVTKVLHADAPHFASPTAENVAASTVAIVKGGGYSHVLASATGFGKNAMPRIAALCDVAQISDIVAVESPDTFVRPIYAGSVLATVRSADPIKVITVRATGFDAAPATGGNADIATVGHEADTGLSRVTGQELSKSERPELTSARIVVSGGRGLGSAENFKLLEALAAKLNAALGASRAAVDAGMFRTTTRSGRPARSWHPISISPLASPARSSTWLA